jgi:hypothetical protein
LALQAFPIAFLAQVSTASASFFGFAADGSVAESMHVAAAEVQLWIPSSAVEQSLFLPQAASGLAQVLSMHLPQSVLLNAGGGGVDAAVDSGAALFSGAESAAAADDSEAAGAAESDAAGASELEEALLSEAGVSGGLDSPPPHASQTGGTATTRRRAAMGSLRELLMLFDLSSAERPRILEGNGPSRWR